MNLAVLDFKEFEHAALVVRDFKLAASFRRDQKIFCLEFKGPESCCLSRKVTKSFRLEF
jgi:hypothetical protein